MVIGLPSSSLRGFVIAFVRLLEVEESSRRCGRCAGTRTAFSLPENAVATVVFRHDGARKSRCNGAGIYMLRRCGLAAGVGAQGLRDFPPADSCVHVFDTVFDAMFDVFGV